MENYLQVKAINLGMNYKDFLVLYYLKNHMYLLDFKSSDIYNEYPIFLKSSSDIYDSLKKLKELEFIDYSWNKGKFNVCYNVDNFSKFFTPDKEDVIKIKRTAPIKIQDTGFDKKENDIIEYYKTLQTLPKCVTMTPIRISALKNALSKYDVEQIKEALLYASKQEWLISKTGEQWCDMSWILKKISDFMSGGKYNKGEIKSASDILGVKSSAVYI